jgi:Ca2+-binding RTX toxin-like protein
VPGFRPRLRGEDPQLMPKIRIEWVPVQLFRLGILGFDHLQLVYQPGDADSASPQDHWFVMEGVRDPADAGPLLGIEGADGRTTLAMANVAAREDLISKIGTPDYRGSRSLPYEGEAFHAWETMASYARDIEGQDFPYIPYGLPGSPTPTINSSSAVASLIHYSGLDPSTRLPFGVHLSPGIATLLGTSGDDIMRVEHGFTTLLGGRGKDEFFGAFEPHRIEKFYGGEGDDRFHWSSGFNIIHGGQPQLDYRQDGTDAIDYSGAGKITITFNHHWVPHKVPEYVTEFEHGLDHLFSIERIEWNEATDHIILGNGVSIVEDNSVHEPVNGNGDGRQQPVPARMRSGFLHHDGEDDINVRSVSGYTLRPGEMGLELLAGAIEGTGDAAANRLIGNDADNILRGMAGDDTLYGGGGDDVLLGGPGSDAYVYLRGDGNDVIVDAASTGDVDALVLAGGIEPADVAFCRPEAGPHDLVLTLVDGSVRIRNFLAGPLEGIERVEFDRAPPWTRPELDAFTATAPACSDATAVVPPAGAEASESVASFAEAPSNLAAPSGGDSATGWPDPEFSAGNSAGLGSSNPLMDGIVLDLEAGNWLY